MIVTRKIDDIEILIQELNSLPNNFLYRGHANADWPLASSLERIIGNQWSAENAERFEGYSLTEFKSKFHLYDHENIHPNSKLAWLSLMQHYGVPTRLLDFTESPYVALYFALESYEPQSQKDFSIFAIDYSALMDCSIAYIQSRDSGFNENRASVHARQDEVFEKIVDRFSYDIAWNAEPRLLNARLDRQAGSFILSGNRSIRIHDVLTSNLYRDVRMCKYCISSSLYEGVYALLRKMNITSKSLYGDLNGLARSIRMQLQIYSI